MLFLIQLFHIPPETAFSLSIYFHAGTLLSVIIYFRRTILNLLHAFLHLVRSLIKGKISLKEAGTEINRLESRMLLFLAVGSFSTGATGVPLFFLINEGMLNLKSDIISILIGGLLIFSGLLLLLTNKKYGLRNCEDVSAFHGFIVGLLQGIAILPGISRSGITISSLLFLNFNEEASLKLSFMLSIPAVIGAIVSEFLFGAKGLFVEFPFREILLSIILTCLIGLLSIFLLLKISRKIGFVYFTLFIGFLAVLLNLPAIFK